MPTTPRHPAASPPPAERVLVCDLQKGNRVDQVFLVETSNFKQTRNNKNFIQTDLRDRSGSIKGIRWEADRELYESFQPDDFIHVAGRVEEFQQNLQIIIDSLRRVDDASIDVAAFLPVTEHDIEELFAELRARVGELDSEPLRSLLEAFLDDEAIAAELKRCPAGKALHHARIGGLLEHIVSLSRAADLIVQNYPRIDRDLLQAGVVLHDIGKLRELSYSRSFRYTDMGQLVGHIAQGIAWVEEKLRAIPDFPQDLRAQLLHLIASHHGQPEFGAVKAPATPEALLLHHLDNIDAKLDLLETVRREQKLGSEGAGEDGQVDNWSVWNPAMGRRLYFS